MRRVVWWAVALTVAGVALVVVTHRPEAPDLTRLKPKPELVNDLRDLPLPALKTRINAGWIGEFAANFYRYGDFRFPASYEELASSVYMPSPDALINPYTNRPVREVAQPSLGDIQWKVSYNSEFAGLIGDSLRIIYFIVRKKGDPLLEESLGYVLYKAPPDRATAVEWVAGLSPLEKRTYWICDTLRRELHKAMYDYLGEITPTFEEAYGLLRWRFPKGVMPNMWSRRRLMRAVEPDRPSPGDFSYMTIAGPDGKPGDFYILCYGEGGRVIYPVHLAKNRQNRGSPPEREKL